MDTTSWHCDPSLLERYRAGTTDSVLSCSIEAHLLGCGDCRTLLSGQSDPREFDHVWAGVRESIELPQSPLPIRLMRRCGLGERDAILLSVSQSLRGPWALATMATMAVLACAVCAAFPDDPRGKAFYLLVAPLIPVLGVVAAFTSTDPINELTSATPYSKARLALLRTLAVTVTTVPLVVALGAVLPGIGWLSVAWLGPALGLTLAALVSLTWWSAEVTAGGVFVVWLAVVSFAYNHDTAAAAVRVQAQLGYLIVAAVTAVVLTARIRSAHLPGGRA